jgi:hypothetical protein
VTSLIDLKLQNDRVDQAIAHMTDILLLIRTERQPDRNDLLWQIYGRARLRMNTESARLHLMIEQLQVEHKERNEMRSRMMSIVGILLVALLLVGGMAVAQDTPTADVVTLEATAVETISSTVVNSPEPTLDVTATASAEPTETAAPEPTPTVTPVPPPPDDEMPTVSIWVLIAPYLSVIGIAILGVIAYLGRAWLVPAGARVPGVIFEPVVAGLNKGLESYGEYVKSTPEKADDVQYEEFAKTFRELIEEMRQARNELNSAAAQLVTTSQSVAQRPVDPSQS